MRTVYKVCILHSNRDYFDYEAQDCAPTIGARVWAPFRNQTRLGIVVEISSETQSQRNLKTISTVIDHKPLLTQELLDLCWWVSAYYQSPLSEVLPLALPKKYRLGQECHIPLTDYYQLLLPAPDAKKIISSRARKQIELVDYLSAENKPVAKQKLNQLGFTSSQILALLDLEIIHLSQEIIVPQHAPTKKTQALTLNEEQAQALSVLSEGLGRYHAFLLQGVTGSGKTEVYLQVIAQVLAQGKQVLILVPEIGLTPQLVARFTARFDVAIAIIHSNLNESERQIAWQLAKDTKVQIVIGTRSCVFTPMPALGLIVIDEEHDASLKQMEGVRYSARDTALMRAHLANIPIILGSATPSLESLYNCQQAKYTLLRLNQKAESNIPLHYQLIDLRAQPLQQGLATPTVKIIEEHLQNGNQVLVFINRRGFAPVLLCHQCGYMADCKACDSHLTMHRKSGLMMCHHCGGTQKIPTTCRSCHSKELIPVGAGTQRIHEYLSQIFPKTKIARIDRDEVRKKHALDEELNKITSGETQLIVGTQMLAKGHHFPRLSLVVILDADAGFYNQDFRALEHLGQLLTQVSGRAGRAELAGHVIIQTHVPNHPLLNMLISEGYDAFAQALLTIRNQAQMPPYHYLAIIRAQSRHVSSVLQFLHATKDQIQVHKLSVMGPALAPLPKKANQHRMQLLIKSPSRKALKNSLTQVREWLTMNKLSSNVRWNVDVDPVDLS